MQHFLTSVAAALGISVSTDYNSPTATVTRYTVSTVTVPDVLPYLTISAPPTLTSVFTPISSNDGSYGSAFSRRLDHPVTDTRSLVSASSLLYSIGEWGSTPISLTPFQILVALFAICLTTSFAFFCHASVENRTELYSLWQYTLGTLRMYQDYVCTAILGALHIGCRSARWLLDHENVIVDAIIPTMRTQFFNIRTFLIHNLGPTCINTLVLIQSWLYHTALPSILHKWTTLILPNLHSILTHAVLRLVPSISTLSRHFLNYLIVYFPIQRLFNKIHLLYLRLSLTTHTHDPTWALTVSAASTSLPALVNILQKNDKLHTHISTMQAVHRREVEELTYMYERDLAYLQRALRVEWRPRRTTHENAGLGMGMEIFEREISLLRGRGQREREKEKGSSWEDWEGSGEGKMISRQLA
jgi:hypothetical protein